MDHLWPIFTKESHVNFCMMCPNQDLVILESIKQNLHQSVSLLTLVEHPKSHEPIIQEEVNYEH